MHAGLSSALLTASEVGKMDTGTWLREVAVRTGQPQKKSKNLAGFGASRQLQE
jgi:hypothetical protein